MLTYTNMLLIETVLFYKLLLSETFRYCRSRLNLIATWLNKEDDYQKLKEVTSIVQGYMFWDNFFKTTLINMNVVQVRDDVIFGFLRAPLQNFYAAVHEQEFSFSLIVIINNHPYKLPSLNYARNDIVFLNIVFIILGI